MKYSELKRLLKENNCKLVREGANHEVWYSPKTDGEFVVGRHNNQEVRTGTLHAIYKQSGINKGGK
ncbi:MAG: type II toxin-antitoxin system HicA family toxin [Clostridiales bacterium]|jgi:predicted RNA binding protein YcfA (HicA-like mRNA interferase family)|nr:type II toxin-antitoxin system HicA family toxin [Clostridiales bacterium]